MRPTMLVVERPDADRLSTRKLVLESAKFNVVNATSERETIETLTRLDVDAVVLPLELRGSTCDDLVRAAKKARPTVKVVVPQSAHCAPSEHIDARYNLFDPGSLVAVCRELFGDPLAHELAEEQEQEQ